MPEEESRLPDEKSNAMKKIFQSSGLPSDEAVKSAEVIIAAQLLNFKEQQKSAVPEEPKLEVKAVASYGFSFLWDFLILIVIIVVMRGFIALPFQVSGHSMEPNLHDEEHIYVDLITPRVSGYERGEVVVFTPPVTKMVDIAGPMCWKNKLVNMVYPQGENPCSIQASYVKRIIGIPGDTVEIKGGHVYVTPQNGTKTEVKEAFLSEENKGKTCIPANNCQSEATLNGQKYTVPEGQYFMLGDNRTGSSDARAWQTTAFVPKDQIAGIVRSVFYSPQPFILGQPTDLFARLKAFIKGFSGVRVVHEENLL
ncbi:MAG: signal peptidase I [Candidatus Peregrinibacteria bacterium]